MAQDQQGYRRAANVAIGGFVVQLVLAALMGLTALGSDTWAVKLVALYLLGGLPIWVVLWVVLNQHRLERIESLEAEQIGRTESRAASVFTETDDELLVARQRLANLIKWALPGASMLTMAYLLIVGGYGLYTSISICKPILTANPLTTTKDVYDRYVNAVYAAALNDGVLAVTFVVAMFVSFIFARFVSGVAKSAESQLLRGGAGYMIGTAVLSLLLLLGSIFGFFESYLPFVYITLFVPLFITILGVEVILNQLLSAYRPRKPGEIPRPAYDSRILGMFTSPTSLAKAISEAINYQFGFEVSKSWFYQLLSRAVVPLIVLGVVVLLAMSCIAIIQPHQQGIITVSGKAWTAEPIGPGIHFKPPWPLGKVETYDVGRVFQVNVGSSAKGIKEDVAILWTNEHAEGKEEFLICAPTPLPDTISKPGQADQQTPGNSLIGGQVAVQYRIRDLMTFVRSSVDPERQLTFLAEREVNRFFVMHDIDALLGPARIDAGKKLRQVLQDAVDKEAKLGLEIVFVGLTGLHPPKDANVAVAFQEQAAVLQERQSAVETAQKDAIQALAQVAGSPETARKIVAAEQEYRAALAEFDAFRRQAGVKPEEVAARKAALDAMEGKIEAMMTSGKAAQILSAAHAYRWERSIGERSKAERFLAELTSYHQAPRLYRARRYLDVLAEGMADARKVVTTTEATTEPVYRIDLKDAANALGTLMKDTQ